MTRPLTAVAERPATAGSRLSVAQLQQALRAARDTAGIGGTEGRDAPVLPAPNLSRVPAPPAGGRRLVVLAAHPGAGASTVALVLAEAVAGTGRRAHLVEFAPPARSGLLTAATAELGRDGSGGWRRGTRGDVVIDRPLEDPDGELSWPQVPAGERETVTVVDLGTYDAGLLDGPGWADAALLVVCRATVPGLRRAEQTLHRLGRPAPVAVLGPARWPGPVRSSAGARLAERRRAGLVVAVPLDRALELTGVCREPLSRRLAASGRALLALMDAAAGGASTAAAAAPRTRSVHQDQGAEQ